MIRFIISLIAILFSLPALSQRKEMAVTFTDGKTLYFNTGDIKEVNFFVIGDNWTESKEVNQLIDELYIYDDALPENATLESFVIRPDDFRLFINCGNHSFKAIEQAGCGTFPTTLYDMKPIIPIYNTYDYSIVGWTIVNNQAEIGLSSANVKLNRNEITNINKSPHIKKMLENDKAIVLIGDSFFGQPFDIFTPAILQGILGQRVYQCGFGGCTMSYRTTNTNFNSFCFAALSDAFLTGDFSWQEEKVEILRKTTDYDYRYQLNELKSIDKSKDLLILCDFQTNDFTSSISIGEKKDNDFNKRTFIGAQAYGIKQFRQAMDGNIRFMFLSSPYRLIDDMPLYNYQNERGLHISDYISAEEENCRRLGVDFIDISNWDCNQPFKRPSNRLDGTHFTKQGSIMFSELLLSLLKEE